MAKPLPAFYIPLPQAKQFVDGFQKNKATILTPAIQKLETNSVWFSYNHFKELFSEMVDRKASGIRIYFTQYPDKWLSPAGRDCGNQLGLIFVVTREEVISGKKTHVDIFLEEEPDFQERLENSNYDYGSPCPTDCDGHFPKLP